MSSTSLYWLPDIANWRQRASQFDASARPGWAEAVALAKARLNLAQTGGLDGVVSRAIREGRLHDAPPPLRVALFGSSTLSHLHAGIRIGALRRGLNVEVFEPDYGQYRSALLSDRGPLHDFSPDVALFAFDTVHLTRGVEAGQDVAATESAIEAVLEELTALWRLARDRFGAVIIQQTALDTSPTVMGSNEHRLAGSRSEATHRINQRLRELADEHGVDLLALDRQAARDGLDAWHSRGQWLRARQEISPSAAPAHGDFVARLIAARRGLSAKCLVLDLDNTLWGGVVGDDGLAGIRLGQGSGEGEAYQEIQTHALALARRGVILAVCSKNDEATIVEAFDTHADMVLKRDHIACLRANWEDKPSNLRAIAQTLNIGLDALVFLDDNPVERDLVRQTLPMVMVPEWPGDPARVPRMLADAGYFEGVDVTEEDRARMDQYAVAARHEAFMAQATDLGAYLRGLEMELRWSAVDEAGLQRAAQLVNKTNQFNVTTRRHTPEAIRRFVEADDAFCLQFRLVDRFLDNGVISVVIGRASGPQEVTLDTWLMSCRVLGREVEQAALNVVAQAARRIGARRLIGEYRPTPRNGMVADLYERLGFRLLSRDDDGTSRFILDLEDFAYRDSPIRITGS